MMTESFNNHLSPEIRAEDITDYVDYLEEKNLKPYIGKSLKATINKKGEVASLSGYYRSEANGKKYSYHFWMYSLINLPARAILEHLSADIRISFLATNLFLIFFGIWLISRIKAISIGKRIVLSLFLIFSPAFWYIDWSHAEVFTAVLAFLGVIHFNYNKKYLSLLFFSIAATHNLPLAIPALFVFLNVLYKSGFKINVLFSLFLCSFWVLLSPLFNLYHFHVPSVIASTDLLSLDVVSFNRLFSFLFDLNQGAILGIPIILLVLIGLLFYDLIKRKLILSYAFLVCILLMSILFMQMTNWNHGNAVVNRYVVWNAAIIIAVFFIRISRFRPILFYALSTLVVFSQVFAIFSQQAFNKIYWHADHLNSLSKYVMNNHPSWYNPDPTIFIARVSDYELSTTDSVVVYTNDKGRITKLLVKEGSITQLINRGIEKGKVDSLNEELSYHNGFAYVNKKQLTKIGYRQEKDNYITVLEKDREHRNKALIRKRILGNPDWYDGIKKQSKEWGLTLDSTMQININYQYQLNQNARKGLK